MVLAKGGRLFLSFRCRPVGPLNRQFSSSAAAFANTKNRVYTSIRSPDELQTLLLLSSSSYKPLITLWTANWCRSCAYVSPIIKELIEVDGVGEAEGGVGYAEVELHASTIGDLGVQYAITSVPTLLAFSRSEAQTETRVMRVDDLKNRDFLTKWIQTEAARGGAGGAGGTGSSLFGKLFGQ